MAVSFGKSALCAQFLIFGTQAESNLTSDVLDLDMCPGSEWIDPPSDWAWSRATAGSTNCQQPPIQNLGGMCKGDPTSVVMQNNGLTSCIRTDMYDCRMDMHEVQQIDLDLRIRDCGMTWSAPLWLTPDRWTGTPGGAGRSGELDLAEICVPNGGVQSNFASGIGEKSWPVDPWWFAGHVTMWNDGGEIRVKMCEEAERDSNGGSCSRAEATTYPDLYGSNACNGANCRFHMVSDIWNGNAGDEGMQNCFPSGPQTANCKHSVRNIRIRGPQFYGKCAVLSATKNEVV